MSDGSRPTVQEASLLASYGDETGTAEPYSFSVELEPGTLAVAPDDGEFPGSKNIKSILISACRSTARTLIGNARFDPYLLSPDVEVRNLTTRESIKFRQGELQLGTDAEFAEGEFYEQPSLEHYYYCDAVKDGKAVVLLIESFQLGMLVQAEIVVPTSAIPHYVRVTDEAVLMRLRRRLQQVRVRQGRT